MLQTWALFLNDWAIIIKVHTNFLHQIPDTVYVGFNGHSLVCCCFNVVYIYIYIYEHTLVDGFIEVIQYQLYYKSCHVFQSCKLLRIFHRETRFSWQWQMLNCAIRCYLGNFLHFTFGGYLPNSNKWTQYNWQTYI